MRRAYLRLAAKWHPDKWATAGAQDQASATVRFEHIKTSYDALVSTPAVLNALDS